jgi:hypothetical protein
MTTKAYFYFYFSLWFKAFENFQNQRTTHSGYLKILKEFGGFCERTIKEPIVQGCSKNPEINVFGC